MIFYKELYYRHIYDKLSPTFEDRDASYTNYCNLFNYIFSKIFQENLFSLQLIINLFFLKKNLDEASDDLDLELPNQWLWDIIDEFIYQFQSFCHYRSKVKKLTEAEIVQLKKREDVS